MRLFGLELTARRAPGNFAPVSSRGGWFPIIREPFTGAWQQNQEIAAPSALTNPVVFACVTLIASDIGKVCLRLVSQDDDGIWTEAESPAFSPVLRKPNRAETIQRFLESWMFSKLLFGNSYVLKQRDDRNVVVALFVLDPTRVTPLVTPDGAIFYRLNTDAISGIETTEVVVPAREIIHDRFNCLFHRLVGVSPLYAGGGRALQGLKIQDSSTRFFTNNARPSGVLTAPGDIKTEQAEAYKARWQEAYSGENFGSVAVLGGGLEYKPLAMTAVDSQLTEQDKRTSEMICAVYHVPASMVDSSHAPPYGNSETLLQQYYSQCLQTHMTGIEGALDEGLELPSPYGTEFDIDDLIWMDTATRTKAASDAIGSGAMSPNEARKKYFGLGPVAGGDSPLAQQQYYSLAALAARDTAAPTPPTPTPEPTPPGPDDEAENKAFLVKVAAALEQKALERFRAA
jgi:HK97 family phage portal protein